MPDNPLKRLFNTARDVMYGMASHDMSRYALRTRASMEHLFILITMGDLLGVPILPPYYSLRLLPYVVPQISTWNRRMRRSQFLGALARRCAARVGLGPPFTPPHRMQALPRVFTSCGAKGSPRLRTFASRAGVKGAEPPRPTGVPKQVRQRESPEWLRSETWSSRSRT